MSVRKRDDQQIKLVHSLQPALQEDVLGRMMPLTIPQLQMQSRFFWWTPQKCDECNRLVKWRGMCGNVCTLHKNKWQKEVREDSKRFYSAKGAKP